MSFNVLICTIENGKVAYPCERNTGENDKEYALRAVREALDWIETNELTVDLSEPISFEELST